MKKREFSACEFDKDYIEEREKLQPVLEKIKSDFFSKWVADDKESEIFAMFGEWIEAGMLILTLKERQSKKTEEETKRSKEIGTYVDYDKELLEYTNAFHKIYNPLIETDKDFLSKYFVWYGGPVQHVKKFLAQIC